MKPFKDESEHNLSSNDADQITKILSETEQKSPHRRGFKIRVRTEALSEYLAVHQAVWPEMREALSRSGWKNYSLFIDVESGDIFGYFEADDVEAATAAMEKEPINTTWQNEMAKYFAQPDGGTSQVLPQYFFLQ